ncbi:MAG TPA: DUF2252 domain-containing protein [Actinophytocola sp.]|jgi:uncharacterized protein (DUF2252 family)|nr:DUF2252 domain-containing protein [Actinophytocola sp.]
MARPASGKTRENARLTRAEQAERGRALRAAVPRTSHADFEAGFRRSDPLAQLESEDEARVGELVPIRYGRMAVSPFTYFRGAALPMASDLAGTVDSGLTVQSCGDAHLANFGMYGSSERNLVLDINDFDETLPGPWEWDVKRLATSMEVVGRNNDYPSRVRRRIVVATVAEYRRAMREFAAWTTLDAWQAPANVAPMRDRFAPMLDLAERKRHGLAEPHSPDHLGALGRFAGLRNGEPKIIAETPLVVPVDELAEPDADEVAAGVHGLLRAYRRSLEPERRMLFDQYRFVDLARTVVGVGGVGTRSWLVLMVGHDEQDLLFMQAKEAGPSVLETFTKPSEFDNAGRRVVVGQRLMQAVGDIFLGWVRGSDDGHRRDFYVRQLRDRRGPAAIETMAPTTMQAYGELCGRTLARAHARSGDRVAIAAYLGSGDAFDLAVREFTVAYADQNERDHATLVEAIKRGRIQAQYGV